MRHAYVVANQIVTLIGEGREFYVRADDGRVFLTTPDEEHFFYPGNWLNSASPEEKSMLSIYPVDEQRESFDPDFYYAGAELINFDQQTGVVTCTVGKMLKPIEMLKATQLGKLAALRYAKETGGLNVGGANVRTDRESQGLINGAYALVQAQPNKVISWKTDAGFVQLDAAQVSAIAVAVGDHVQNCFETEAAHAAAIQALTDPAAVVAYNMSAGW